MLGEGLKQHQHGSIAQKCGKQASNTSSFCLFPWNLLQRPTEEKVIPCQPCVRWVLVLPFAKLGRFSTTFLNLSWLFLLFQAPCLCTHLCGASCLGLVAHLLMCLLGTCREGAAPHQALQSRTAVGTEPTAETRNFTAGRRCPWLVRVERNSQGDSFSSAGFCPRAGRRRSHHCRAENMTVEMDAVF